jgi:hypothetical protein
MSIQRTINLRCDGVDQFGEKCRRSHYTHTNKTDEARRSVNHWGWLYVEGKDLCPDCTNLYTRRERAKIHVEKFNARFKPGETVIHRPYGSKGEVHVVELQKTAYVTEDGFARTRTSGPGGFHACPGNISKLK